MARLIHHHVHRPPLVVPLVYQQRLIVLVQEARHRDLGVRHRDRGPLLELQEIALPTIISPRTLAPIHLRDSPTDEGESLPIAPLFQHLPPRLPL